MKNLYVFISVFQLFSCEEKEKIREVDLPIIKESVITMNYISNYDSIVNRVELHGDIEAYSELFYNLKDSNFEGRTDTLMYYSRIMAEKYNYEKAYIDYLDAITEKYGIKYNIGDYSSIDISTLNMKEKGEIIIWLDKMLVRNIISVNQYKEVNIK